MRRTHRTSLNRLTPLAALLAIAGVGGLTPGCGPGPAPPTPTAPLTPTAVRAERRYYNSAPPVIPHPPMPGPCIGCHTPAGRALPGLGTAPAHPHAHTPGVGPAAPCRQCHVFQTTNALFAANRFEPWQPGLRPGPRAYPGAPPVIPHALFLREDCLSCHAGIAARPEIVCDHPERTNCLQCHLQQTTPRDAAWPARMNPDSPATTRVTAGERR